MSIYLSLKIRQSLPSLHIFKVNAADAYGCESDQNVKDLNNIKLDRAIVLFLNNSIQAHNDLIKYSYIHFYREAYFLCYAVRGLMRGQIV